MYFNPWMWGMQMDSQIMMYLLIAMLIPLAAQGYLMSTFGRYKKARAAAGLTGYEVARSMLDKNGLHHVQIQQAKRKLGDHYDPKSKTVRLSHDIHDGTSIAAVAVAAHEVGHAIQHAKNYAPLTLRSAFVPVVSIANRLGFLVIIMGMMLEAFVIAEFGILMIASLFVFQLITLPVEFNASTRALAQLNEMNLLSDSHETRGARQVLTAAALTYVAALVVALMELLRWVAILNNSRGRRN